MVHADGKCPVFCLFLLQGVAKEVVSSEDLPHLSCPFQLWLTLELHKGHYLNALAAEAGWGGLWGVGEDNDLDATTHCWLADLLSPFAIPLLLVSGEPSKRLKEFPHVAECCS